MTAWPGWWGGRDRAVGAAQRRRDPSCDPAADPGGGDGGQAGPGAGVRAAGRAGFEVVPLAAVAAVVVGPEVLSPAEAGRRAWACRGLAEGAAQPQSLDPARSWSAAL